MSFLLDVNVLIALIDPLHRYNQTAIQWFEKTRASGWSTCPLTENGVIRIVGNPRYLNFPGGPSTVAEIVRQLRRLGRHAFWADDLSVVDDRLINPALLTSHNQITDTYLLALAVKNGGRLATFDSRLRTDAVRGGAEALSVIPAP